MSVFTGPGPGVCLPITYGRPEQDLVDCTIVLDEDVAPWISPCGDCTVVDADGCHQAGCETCRGRGWFNDRTGLPVGLWWWYLPADRAEWTVHVLVSTLLRAVGHNDAADRVDAIPRITTDRLQAKRIAGSGFLKNLTDQLGHENYDRLEVSPTGGRIPSPGRGRKHPALTRAGDAAYDFAASHLGWWAWTTALAAADLLRTRRHRGDDVADVDELLDELNTGFDAEHGVLLIGEDRIHGPERPTRWRLAEQHEPVRCESHFVWNGDLYQCCLTDHAGYGFHLSDCPDPAVPDGVNTLEWVDEDANPPRCTPAQEP